MRLFSDAGMKALARVCRARRPLFAFDFDGTLAPIHPHPHRSQMDPATETALSRLAERVPIAIVTGRSAEDLSERLRLQPRHVLSNHGLVRDGRGDARALRLARHWKSQLEIEDLEGCWLEDKRYSLTLHYRHAPSRARARQALLREMDRLQPPPRRIGGKFVYNLLPDARWNKGSALVSLMRERGYTQALYIGDDDTDEDVFRLPRANRVLSVRVGARRSTAASFSISRQAEVRRVLMTLLKILS